MKNLNFWTIIIVGVSLALVPLAFGLFWHWMPNGKESGYYENYISQLETEINKKSSAIKRKETAIKIVEEKASQWRQIVAARTPSQNLNTGGIDVGVNGWQLVIDSRKFRNNVQRAVNAQVKRGGVTVINGPFVQNPPEEASTVMSSFFNYPAIAFPVLILNFGAVTVQGTYEQIMANVRSYSTMPNYLAVADGLTLTGTSPRLTGTYSLSVIGFIRGNKVFSALPESGAAGGGAPGGPPGQAGRPGRGGPPAGLCGPG